MPAAPSLISHHSSRPAVRPCVLKGFGTLQNDSASVAQMPCRLRILQQSQTYHESARHLARRLKKLSWYNIKAAQSSKQSFPRQRLDNEVKDDHLSDSYIVLLLAAALCVVLFSWQQLMPLLPSQKLSIGCLFVAILLHCLIKMVVGASPRCASFARAIHWPAPTLGVHVCNAPLCISQDNTNSLIVWQRV